VANPSPVRLDWCGYDAARYAVEHWHYSKSLPTPPLVRVGVWEGEAFVGVVLFGRGANKHLGSQFGLRSIQVCELVRIAMRAHVVSVSRVVSIALAMLRKKEPGLRLVVSFADPAHQHLGVIYQAGNWIYTGATDDSSQFVDAYGRHWHPRQVSAIGVKPQYGTLRKVPRIDACTKVPMPGKHRYVMPLDAAMRAQCAQLAQPYPKRGRSREIAAAPPRAEGGVIPTRPLQHARDDDAP
jgi:hypothetical protein